jgi:uncharacterized membrane protein YeaQ/YmgE (transglycosylase-associated protein family)
VSKGDLLSIIAWIVFGLIVGYAANLMLKGEAYFQNLGLAVIGAIIGGWLFSVLGATSIGFNVVSFLFAMIGSIVALVGYHTFHRGSY